MHSLIIVAIGLFFNPAADVKTEAIAQVGSVVECAQLINDNRVPQVLADGSTWYLVDAVCRVVEQ